MENNNISNSNNAMVKVFESEQFGQVRTVMIDNEPWFVAADVCNYFGATNRNRVMQNVDPEDKGGYANEYPWRNADGYYS